MSQSSKRLEKIKKCKGKLRGSGFDFLLSSMDRDKENHIPNAYPIHYGHLTQSVNIDSQITVPASHTHPMLRSTNMMLHSTKPNIYVDNVKILDCSAQSISDMNEFNNSKQTTKNYLSSKQVERSLLASKIPMKQSQIISKIIENSNVSSLIDRNEFRNIDKHQFEEFLSKVKYYLLLSNDIVGPSSYISMKAKSKLKRYEQELEDLMRRIKQGWAEEQRQLKHEQEEIKMRSGYMMKGKQSEDYLNVINKLESQRQKLNSLISKHELANIKMFVKINEGESEEIQKCKKQLALLFNKYKELEKIIKRDKKELIVLAKEKKQLEERNVYLLQQNKQLSLTLQALSKDQHRSPSYLSIHSSKRYRHSNKKDDEPHMLKEERVQVGESNFDSSLNSRGDLRIQSLKNSHISDEDQAPRSSLSTITSRMNPNKGGRIGINLNALIDSIKQQNFKKLLEQPQRLKKIVEECRKTILQMQTVINQQNQELQLCIKTLQQNQQKLASVENKLLSCQSKLQNTQQQLKKQRLQKVQLETLLSKEKEKLKMSKNKSTKKAWNDIESRSQNKEDRIKVYEGKDVFMLDLGVDLKYLDQYRIIATQAKTLEKCLKQKQNR